MSSLKEEVALITGANRGIGKSLVAHALKLGVGRVYATSRTEAGLDDLKAAFGDSVKTLLLDLERPDTIRAAAAQAGDTTFVINNAGILDSADALDEHAVRSLEKQLLVNTTGLLHVAQAFAPVLKANGGGALAQLNSVVSIQSLPGAATYSASKAASYSLTLALRQELGAQGTHVISVHPGPIATDMAREAGIHHLGESPEAVSEAVFRALQEKTFHVFPDSVAQQVWQQYESYAASLNEGLALPA